MNEREPASPCIKVCELDPRTQICRGCYRTLAEIASWPTLSADEKRDVLRRLEARRRADAGPARR